MSNKSCGRCGATMQKRTGEFGSFWFCPKQHENGCGTVGTRRPKPVSRFGNDRPFDADIDDPLFDDGSDYRPY